MLRTLSHGLAPLFAVLFLAPAAFAQREFGFDNRKPSGQPYLSPEESLKRFKIAPEFEIDLFAAEPLVVNPIAFTIDEKGRIWVVECFEYPKRTPYGKLPRDRIVILEDTDGDGTADKHTVFAEGKDFPVPRERLRTGYGAFDMISGIEVGHGGVFIGAPPYLWYIENKDDKPGKFEVLLKGFGSQDTHETLNTFQWGPDGWLYGLHGIFTNSTVTPANPIEQAPGVKINGGVWRYHPTQKKFEIFAEGTSNPWGMDWRNTDGQFIACCCVIPHLFHITPGGIYKRQAGASFNPYAYSYLNEICDHTFHKESGWAHAGLISLDVPHMPEKYRDSVIFGSIHGCSVKRNVLKKNGSTFTASREDDFLQSGDKNFRPINMKWGPNGDIYLIDWHDQNPCHQTAPDDWDYERGRIYRIQLKGTKLKKAEDLGKLDTFVLGELMNRDNPFPGRPWNPYVARTAARLLRERSGSFDSNILADLSTIGTMGIVNKQVTAYAATLEYLLDLFKGEKELIEFVQRMKTMASQPPLKVKPEHWVYLQQPLGRVWTVRILGQRQLPPKVMIALAELGEVEPDIDVRRELASAALHLADKHDVTPLLRSLLTHKEDAKDPVIPQLVWLAYEKVLASGGRKSPDSPRKNPAPDGAGSPLETELAWLAEQAPNNEFVRDQIVPKTMRRLVATGNADDLKLCIAFVRSLKDVNSREKALDGLVLALKDQNVNAPEGWAELQAEVLKQDDPRLVPLVNRLAVSFRDPKAIKRAVSVAANTSLPTADRVEAVRQIGQLKVKEAMPLLLNMLRKDTAISVRAEAARSLAAFDDPKLAAEILSTWKDYPKTIQPDVVNTLATRKEWAKQLLQAMADGKVDRAAVTDNTILRIQAFKDAELNKLIEKAWGRSRQTPAELIAVIEKTRASMNDAPGSFARGKLVFDNTCGKCHKFENKGADVGPSLDGAARDIEYILVNVIDPNRVIGAPYFVRVARLQDGTVQQGLLAEEDDKSITLKLENGVFKKIAKADLEGAIQVVEKSLMPEGLGYNMTPQDFRDLVRYVMANPFLTDVKVNSKPLSAGVLGRVQLPGTKDAGTTIEAEFTASADFKTVLLIGSSADFDVKIDGKPVGTGKGTGRQVQPDQAAFEVTLSKGKHTLSVTAKVGTDGGALYARFADPDRKLRYPDMEVKK